MASSRKNPDSINIPPFETEDLRKNLTHFLNSTFINFTTRKPMKIGDVQWGVYAFYDYDGEPIYVGQTNEKVRTRIRRHLTNQRTDAVAMSVLDPFEVFEIAVWPLPEYDGVSGRNTKSYMAAKAHLNALERSIYMKALNASKFSVVLNEKDPPPTTMTVQPPEAHRQRIVSPEVHAIRAHPDFRISRRALIIARLAQVISERKVQGGLRRVLLAQAKRLEWLADRRYTALGGEASVESESDDAEDQDDGS